MSETKQMAPGLSIPVRSALIRLATQRLMLISPIPGIHRFIDEIKQLGEVTAIVAPMSRHHLGLPHAMAAFPQARVFGGPAVQKKRPDIRFTDLLTETTEPLWASEVGQFHVEGFKDIDETVFFHRASATLYLSDLAFNPPPAQTTIGRVFMKVLGGSGTLQFPWVSKIRVNDRAALRRTVDQLIALQPKRIVMCHGDTVSTDATGALERAFAFLGGSARAPQPTLT